MDDVAAGRLLPEAVAALAGRLRILNAVARLSLAEQRRVVEGEPLPYVAPTGEILHRPLAALNDHEASRVIRDGRIVPPKMQSLRLERLRYMRETRSLNPGRPPEISIDPAQQAMRIGARTTVRLSRVIEVLEKSGYSVERKPHAMADQAEKMQ